MKGTKLFIVTCGVLILSANPAWAVYSSIAHNLQDGIADTSYQLGVLNITSASTQVALDDGGVLGGTVTNALVNMETYYSSFSNTSQPGFPSGAAHFSGGSFSLTFDYDGLPYEISGPIAGLKVGVTSASGGGSIVQGEGLFTAATKNLPGSGIWPDGGGFSSIHSITLHLGVNLSGFNWDPQNAILLGGETLYNLQPNDSAAPEPASLALMVFGGLALMRRRR